jgi:hypothetical protein
MKTENTGDHCCRCCLAEDAVTLASLEARDLTDEQKEVLALACKFLIKRYTEAVLPTAFAEPWKTHRVDTGTCDT